VLPFRTWRYTYENKFNLIVARPNPAAFTMASPNPLIKLQISLACTFVQHGYTDDLFSSEKLEKSPLATSAVTIDDAGEGEGGQDEDQRSSGDAHAAGARPVGT
jgi:hypothetical protein